MRPLRLTLQAFGPYAGCEVVDFRAAVAAGLFGIYGRTGSGKSTLFSAMTFALFGEAARRDQEPPSLRSDLADAALPTEVEFVFDLAERRYVLLRRPDQSRPKQRGEGETRAPHEAFLFDATGRALETIGEGGRGKILAEKKVRDVDQAVADLLGYGPDQFRQIVLLPQGRFEAFLAAKTRDRLEILRELFDVSLYRRLAVELKTGAEAAERAIREDQALCQARLEAEGFESPAALAEGVAAAQMDLAALGQAEATAAAVASAAEAARNAAVETARRLEAAAEAEAALAAVMDRAPEMAALARHLAAAEQAQALADPDARVAESMSERQATEARRDGARQAAKRAGDAAAKAAEAERREAARADETEALRQRVEALARHQHVLAASQATADALARAETERAARGRAVDRHQAALTEHKARQHQHEAARDAAREGDAKRQALEAKLARLETTLAAARAFETASEAHMAAETGAARCRDHHSAAAAAEHHARDQRLAAQRAQRMHLASELAATLSPGDPCPVCGATEHPSPARPPEAAMNGPSLDAAEEAWTRADARLRDAEQALATASALVTERAQRLETLPVPELSAETLSEERKAIARAIAALGTARDRAAAEAAFDATATAIRTLEAELDTALAARTEAERQVTSETARLDAQLAAVPLPLRTAPALEAALAEAGPAYETRREAHAEALEAARRTREAAIAADRDAEAAAQTHAASEARLAEAQAIFAARLAEAGLTPATYAELKPAIPEISATRASLAEYERRRAGALARVEATAEAVAGTAVPDLGVAEAALSETRAVLAKATETRAEAGLRATQLDQLHGALSETLRRLEAAETASGPLRELSDLTGGRNGLGLDLETYAIGAVFDRVLQAANMRLGPMTANRYALEREWEGGGRGRRGLGIQVFDVHTGKARPTTTLSGGETFIAALALALGLADVVEGASGKLRLDTIFIDEGFGSLDAEAGSGTLEQVLQVLSALVSPNRAIGLISHVPLVQEAVPNGFYVHKRPGGSAIEPRLV
ncbi:MAG: AAA family ATPase [Pseudomonadota bacterium]